MPHIYFLSAGASAKLFQETLVFAHESGANLNYVLGGRATWAGSVKATLSKVKKQSQVASYNRILKILTNPTRFFKTATSWKERA